MSRFDDYPAGHGLKKLAELNSAAEVLNEALKDDGSGGGALGVVVVGSGTPPTAGGLTTKFDLVNDDGATAGNLITCSISNVGTLDAVINTGNGDKPFPPGLTINLKAEIDPLTNVYKRVQSIAYDATGTLLAITTTE